MTIFADLGRGQVDVLDRRLVFELDRRHRLPVAEPGAAGGRHDHVLDPAFLHLVQEGVHDLAGAGRDPARAHVDRDLGPALAVPDGHERLGLFPDLRQILDLEFFLFRHRAFAFFPSIRLMPPLAGLRVPGDGLGPGGAAQGAFRSLRRGLRLLRALVLLQDRADFPDRRVPWYSLSTTTTGPMAQQPRQATVSRVNCGRPSFRRR